MLPSVTTTPQAIHTIRAIPTDPAPSSTPLGEMKIPDPAKTTLHYIIIMYTGNRNKQRTVTLSPACVILYILQLSLPSMFTMVFKCQSYTKYEMRKRDMHYSMSLICNQSVVSRTSIQTFQNILCKRKKPINTKIASYLILFYFFTALNYASSVLEKQTKSLKTKKKLSLMLIVML